MEPAAPLDPALVDEATGMCVRAFAHYPLVAALFPGPPERREAVTGGIYGATLRDALRHGHVDAVVQEGRVLAVAAWLPPGAYPLSMRRDLAFARAVVPAVLARFPQRAAKGIQAMGRLERHHPEEPSHWYLATVAVDPPHQGRGLGTHVVGPVLDRADRVGEPAFLETADPGNVGWYRWLGFEAMTEAPCFAGGPPQWSMWREPGSAR